MRIASRLTLGATLGALASASILACKVAGDGGGGGSAAVGGGSGGAGGGGGGQQQVAVEDADTPDKCVYLGAGGGICVFCEHVTGVFSEPMAAASVDVEIDTSAGDHLVVSTWPDLDDPALTLDLSADETMAVGFRVSSACPHPPANPHYAPESLQVSVSFAGAVVAQQTLEPTYSCVAHETQWCWTAPPETIVVTLP